MTFVLGREEGIDDGPAGTLGRYRALDGSDGAPLGLDFDGPHAVLTVGKRGYGKSYTLGVIAEGLARAEGVAPTVVDPMGVFSTLADDADGRPVPATVVREPTVEPSSLGPRSWCSLLDLSPESGPGSLVWRAAGDANGMDELVASIERSGAPDGDVRAAVNHVRLADSWGVFDDDGLSAADLDGGEASVVDLSGLDRAPANAVVLGIADALYRGRVTEDVDRLPWLLIDEAHTFFDGVAGEALERILTRGRAPGVSIALATQRPSAVPEVGISQADLLVAHRLTASADLDRLRSARPTYVTESLSERMPTEPGEVVVVDDATETVHTARIRERDTPHDGESPAASEVTVRER